MGNITRLSVLSTGTVRIRPQHIESDGRPLAAWLLTETLWTDWLPINVYVIEHSDGVVLVDAGQDRRSVTERRRYYPRGIMGYLYGRLGRFDIGAGDTLVAGLRDLGYDPADVTHVVVTHLHQDHVGGIGELPNATVLVADAEWRAHQRPAAVMEGYLRRHIDLPGVTWERVTFETLAPAELAPFASLHDIFGDGTVVLLPTPGHSAGSLSVLVRIPEMPWVLCVGDLTFDVRVLDADKIPGVGDAEALHRASRAVLALRERHPDLVILPAHDPAAAGALAQATAGRLS
ncbi:N-acyl homoserine lactonase QqlR [soil metagenome]